MNKNQVLVPRSDHLFSPVVDFLLLGGGSIIALLTLRLMLGAENDSLFLSTAATLYLANFINHPHFAHSYQIFYANFGRKLICPKVDKGLRVRYWIVGIFLPLALIAALLSCVIFQQPRALGLAANTMFFLVGWHYAKQGYGMAMLDASIKKRFFTVAEKRLLLRNGYAVWLFSWMLANNFLKNNKNLYFGVSYFLLEIPHWLLITAGAAATATTIRLIYVLIKRSAAQSALPINGLIAYFVTLYVWLLIRDPLVLLWVPLFHSLQYLVVIWRFKINELNDRESEARISILQFTLFLVFGFGMGYAVFWELPGFLDRVIDYRSELFGTSVFYYVVWIFINIHHYFLDTVMWRKENSDVTRYLFGSRPRLLINKSA